MIIAADVHYGNEFASAAGVIFNRWEDTLPLCEKRIQVPVSSGYIPGSFYLRELPCILELLRHIIIYPDVIIIDGYVYLGKEQKDGLGAHLYRSLNKEIPVIGAAKNPFLGVPEESKLLRGKSNKPLYITSIGIELEEAKDLIRKMAGTNRLPDMLKRADRLSRQ